MAPIITYTQTSTQVGRNLAGMFVLSPKLLSFIGKSETEDVLSVKYLISRGFAIETSLLRGVSIDVNTVGRLLLANRLALRAIHRVNSQDHSQTQKQNTGLIVGPGEVLDSDFKIIGPSIVGQGCKIKSGTVIGPFCSVGERCTIKSKSISHSIIMSDTYLASVGSITNTVVGESAKINLGSKHSTMSVGDNSIIESSSARSTPA